MGLDFSWCLVEPIGSVHIWFQNENRPLFRAFAKSAGRIRCRGDGELSCMACSSPMLCAVGCTVYRGVFPCSFNFRDWWQVLYGASHCEQRSRQTSMLCPLPNMEPRPGSTCSPGDSLGFAPHHVRFLPFS